MTPPFLFKELFFAEVNKIGAGMVNCHAHLDRAGTLTPEIWQQASALMEKKWLIMRDIKTNYCQNPDNFKKRVRNYIDYQIEQGIVACRTHVDADSIVKMKVVEMMVELRKEYKNNFTLQLVAHPIEGFLNEDNTGHCQNKLNLFEKACDLCDVVGGLPSRDRQITNGAEKHCDIIFSIAKNLGKDLDVHIDQENNPLEKDTELFLKKTREYGWEGNITIIHGISLAAQPENYRKTIYKEMESCGVNVICCPRAAIGMKQHYEKTGPIHNSIAPVVELLEAGVNVSIGTDNISDIFIPNSDGTLFDEINLLADAVREYNLETLAKIATINGEKTLKI